MAIIPISDLKQLVQNTIYDNLDNEISGQDVQTAIINAIDTLDSLAGFVNVHKANGQTTINAYGSKAAARAAVPTDAHFEGVVIAYKLSTGWLIEQNLDATAGTWNNNASWQTIAPLQLTRNNLIFVDWQPNTIYVVGNQVQNDGLRYRCTQEHTSGVTFDSDYWLQITDFELNGGTALLTIQVGADEYPICQTNVKIAGFGTNSEAAGANNVGDIWYNTNIHLLRIQTQITPTRVSKTYPIYPGAIYTYNNNLYLWNGSDLVKVSGDYDALKGNVDLLFKVQPLEPVIISNSAVEAMTGQFVQSTVNDRTDYVNIEQYDSILYSRLDIEAQQTVVGLAFYDEQYQYIDGQLALTHRTPGSFYVSTIIRKPANAFYMVLTKRKNLTGFFADGLSGIFFDETKRLENAINRTARNQWEYAAQKRFELLAKTQWQPITGIAPVNSGNPVFPAGVKQTGMPYSSTRQIDKYIGYNVTMRTFLTALHNPYSLLYTENINVENNISAWGFDYKADQCSTYMGVQCTTFVNYICGMKVVWLSHQYQYAEKMGYIEKLGRPNHNKIRLFDMIYLSGHDMVVSDIQYNGNDIISITVSEATPPSIRNRTFTPEQFDNEFYNGVYTLYRVSQAYNPSLSYEKINDIQYNDDVCTFLGDYAAFREGAKIVINYNAGNYTTLEIYKENTLMHNVSINPNQHYVDITDLNLNYGLYRARLTDGVNHSDYTYFEVIECNVDLTLIEEAKCKVDFSSSNGMPIYVDFCADNGDSIARKQFTPEELLRGTAIIDVAELNSWQPRYSISGCYCKITFQGEYGAIVNEMIPTGIQ